jgi:small subunit ribosomal protein S2
VASVTMKQLLEAGVHFGHQTRRWNPKMKPFIFAAKNGIYIIDLQKTVRLFRKAWQFVRDTVAEGRDVLFVGTKRQAQESIQEEATRCNMPYVNHRWLGGMLTNFQTIRRGIEQLKELEAMSEDGRLQEYPKKEILQLQKERAKLEKNLGGIKNMDDLPGAVFVVDSRREYIAVREARKLGIPVVAIVDSNGDPDEIDYVIPGNDDAIRAIKLFSRLMADACLEGLSLREERIRAEAGEEAEVSEAAAEEPKGEAIEAATPPEAAEEPSETPAAVEPPEAEGETAPVEGASEVAEEKPDIGSRLSDREAGETTSEPR